MYVDIMLDLETLSTRTDARIIQIGACVFDRYGGDLKNPEVIDQFKVNVETDHGSVSQDTVEWWEDQKSRYPDLEVSLNYPAPVSLQDGLQLYRKFAQDYKCMHEWSNGSNFDNAIIGTHYHDLRLKNPFKYYKARDLRTITDLLDPNQKFKRLSQERVKGATHDALVDCLRQTFVVQACFRNFKGFFPPT